MRAADLAEQARIQATLTLTRQQLAAANIPTPTATILLDHTERALHLRTPNHPVGWLLHFTGDTTCAHVDIVTVVLLLQRANGRLVLLLDLETLWRQGAGDAHLMREAAERMPKTDPIPQRPRPM